MSHIQQITLGQALRETTKVEIKSSIAKTHRQEQILTSNSNIFQLPLLSSSENFQEICTFNYPPLLSPAD